MNASLNYLPTIIFWFLIDCCQTDQKKSVNPCQPVPNAPLKKINRDEERDEQVVEQTRGREIQALALGPIPWLATAYAIDTSLILSVWVRLTQEQTLHNPFKSLC